jgi:hypothetical protein
MKSFSEYLGKFKNLTPPDGIIRETIREVVKENTNIDIPIKNITIRNNTIYIKNESLLPSLLLLKKEKILFKLKEILENKAPTDLQF